MPVRPVRPEEWRELRALRLRALADSPEAFARTVAEREAGGLGVVRLPTRRARRLLPSHPELTAVEMRLDLPPA